MEICELKIPGAFELRPQVHRDERGSFVKTFHHDAFELRKLATSYREQYYSASHQGVLRGLHFQTPPFDHVKLVSCLQGRIFDVGLDLRKGSPTYGQHFSIVLSSEHGNMLYLPKGFAHGFLTLSQQAIVTYCVTTVHSPEHDTGVNWASAGIAWPNPSPLLSARDEALPRLQDFRSPFDFSTHEQAA